MENRYHLAMRAEQPLEPLRVKQIADCLGISAYDVRMRIKTPVLRSMSIFQDEAAAHDAASQVHSGDLTTIVYRELELPAAAPFAAFRMGRQSDGFIFEDRKGQRLSRSFAEIALFVVGLRSDINQESSLEDTTTYQELHGRRYSYRVDVVKKRQRALTMFVAFFPVDANAPTIHLVADQFDFSCLGKQKGGSDMINQRKVVELVERALVDTPVDKRLLEHRVYPDIVPHNRRCAPDAAFAAAQLIRWEHDAKLQGGYLNTCRPGQGDIAT